MIYLFVITARILLKNFYDHERNNRNFSLTRLKTIKHQAVK